MCICAVLSHRNCDVIREREMQTLYPVWVSERSGRCPRCNGLSRLTAALLSCPLRPEYLPRGVFQNAAERFLMDFYGFFQIHKINEKLFYFQENVIWKRIQQSGNLQKINLPFHVCCTGLWYFLSILGFFFLGKIKKGSGATGEESKIREDLPGMAT